MTPHSPAFFRNLTVVMLSLLLFEGRAQPLSYCSFSSISTTQIGSSFLSQPVSRLLQSECISLTFGLSLHYAVKRNGTFLIDCSEKDTLAAIKFLFYPNPVHNKATLSILTPRAGNQKIQLQIIDALGRIVRSQWVSWQDLYPGSLLDMSSLAAGIYFLKISSSSFNSVIKIIKI